ncbi:putative dpy-30 motif-containing protein [Neospora caninum Liverpool]|uniref:Putative dpy-30 motif-containing protein n=1 Tax=Neospora caninum (strain Liverpool) TaxID=572307 RepID=F0VHV0_NEOCL|nr:putative dpy-30 motif-containing protein [Neospora caninum Liverpool]CBZ53311.1 putative dpy-30 motif-containing protein [Neospora caninum Liverpool]|eukprot:XP_003883343.1 putative dpy-30 motif-containing protein [Neospora caninum Liverpool]
MRIFINHVDTYTGYALCAGLRRFNGVTNRMFGTAKGSRDEADDKETQPATQGDAEWSTEPNRLTVPASIRRLIFKRNPQQLLKNLLSCSLIVYDLHTTDPDEVEDIVKKLRRAAIEKPTVFVLISSVMVWAKTKQEFVERDPEEETQGDDGDDASSGKRSEQKASDEEENGGGDSRDDEANEDDSDADSDDSEEEEPVEEKDTEEGAAQEEDEPLPERFKGTKSISRLRKPRKSSPPERVLKPRLLTGSEFERRIPAKRYEKWKTIETLVMSLGSKENLTTYVIAAGAMYGQGEGPFYAAFKAAWLGLQTHKIISPGNNFVPTIHTRDLASLVRRLAAGTSEEPYHIAVDMSHVTQYDIIQTIVNRVGQPYEVEEVTQEQAMLFENADLLTVDLRMVPSSEMTALDFPWLCKEGLPANIDRVAAEFCKWRNLRQVKILVAGPPGSGKSLLTGLLAAKLNTPAVRTQDVVDASKLKGDELGSLLREKWSQLVEDQKKKKSNGPGAGTSSGANTSRRVRFDVETMTKIFNAKLSENVCRFRGFVLDGYPRTYQEAAALFLRPKKKEDGGKDGNATEDGDAGGDLEEQPSEEEPPPAEMEFEPLKAPDYVIILKSADVHCEERMMNVPQNQVIPGHNDRDGFFRRLAQHKLTNESVHGEPSLADFFQVSLPPWRLWRLKTAKSRGRTA